MQDRPWFILRKASPVHSSFVLHDKKRPEIFSLKTSRPLRTISKYTLRSSLIQTILSVPEFTVRTVSPVQPPKRVADYTAGGESHPALKNHFLNYDYYISFIAF